MLKSFHKIDTRSELLTLYRIKQWVDAGKIEIVPTDTTPDIIQPDEGGLILEAFFGNYPFDNAMATQDNLGKITVHSSTLFLLFEFFIGKRTLGGLTINDLDPAELAFAESKQFYVIIVKNNELQGDREEKIKEHLKTFSVKF